MAGVRAAASSLIKAGQVCVKQDCPRLFLNPTKLQALTAHLHFVQSGYETIGLFIALTVSISKHI